MAEQLRGYLVVKVLEAAGHNGDDVKVWDDSLKEVFVKSRFERISARSDATLVNSGLPVHGQGLTSRPPAALIAVEIRGGSRTVKVRFGTYNAPKNAKDPLLFVPYQLINLYAKASWSSFPSLLCRSRPPLPRLPTTWPPGRNS